MRLNAEISLLLALLLAANPLLAQASSEAVAVKEKIVQKTSDPDKPKKNESRKAQTSVPPGFFRSYWQDEKAIWTSPFRTTVRKALPWAGLALITGVLIHNDEKIYRDIKNYQADHDWLDRMSPNFSRLCEGPTWGVAGLFWLGGVLTKNRKARETGVMAVQAMLHSFVVVQMIKHLTGRARPSAYDGEDKWVGPSGFFKRYEAGKFSYYDAMASGHTITIWSLATVIAHQYRKNPLVPVLCYSLATLGGMATITEDLHWISDVVVGAALGYAIARFVVKNRAGKFQVMPVIQKGGAGIGISIAL